jgi:hypothetical protein
MVCLKNFEHKIKNCIECENHKWTFVKENIPETPSDIHSVVYDLECKNGGIVFTVEMIEDAYLSEVCNE